MNSKSKTPWVADYYDGGAAAAAVNDDVLTEILVRLPAKSLIRFKSVCKRWLSLISGDRFCRLHTLRRHKQPSLLLCTDKSQFFYFNPVIDGEKNPMLIPYNFALPNPKILSSCSGLMLLQCDSPQTGYYVYNPTTKQSRKIIVDEDQNYKIVGLNLAFDPSKSPHYKIVCVRETWEQEELQLINRLLMIEVYDSVSQTWEICSGPFRDYNADAKFSDGVHCGNSIYWKMFLEVMYFDIDKNDIGYLRHPYIDDDVLPGFLFDSLKLQESNGRLYLFGVEQAGVALFELQGDDHDHHSQSWFLKFGHSQMYSVRPSVFYPWRNARILRFISGTNGDWTSILVTLFPGKIRAYRLIHNRFEGLVDLRSQPFFHENSMRFDYQNVRQFGESLATV